jgi:alpha,alpha-trehalase
MPEFLLNGGLVEVRERIQNALALSLFFSFDGALTRIVEDPAKAAMEQPIWSALETLSRRDDLLPVVLSGRSLADLKARVGISEIVYAANHALEISGRGLRFIEPFAAARSELLARISESLAVHLRAIPGASVEYKGLTTSVHYRHTAVSNFRDVERIVHTVVAPGVSPFFIEVGKMVLEIIPKAEWHKGAAVCWINSRLSGRGNLSIYIGDDRTDETAFRRLSDGITVCVGNPEWSAARYYVRSPGDVGDFLAWLSGVR